MGSAPRHTPVPSNIRTIPLAYNGEDSARQLILTLRPEWKSSEDQLEFVRFTDGITNTLLKVINKASGTTEEDIDNGAVLLRAYGQGTDLIIDRERETQNHELLMQYGLAPQLLARFENGMLYRFIRGAVTSPADLRRQSIWRAVAARLAEWHARVPCIAKVLGAKTKEKGEPNGVAHSKASSLQTAIDTIAPNVPPPNLWTVMQKWIFALSNETEAEKSRQETLQKELVRLVGEFSTRQGLGDNSLVFAHCDLLSGNVIIQPRSSLTAPNAPEVVSFIDYEYATPSPAAFDVANHFAEWGGFDCDFHMLPTRSQRRDFIAEYIRSYFSHLGISKTPAELDAESATLFDEIDIFRGIPGFYWGIWALIQARISKIDFDYASYAEIRLGEYWAWRAESDGSRQASGEEMPIRERRWAQEE